MTSGTDIAQILRPHRAMIELHADEFPLLRDLGEFIDGGGMLTGLDRENLAGVATYIFSRLKVADYPQVKTWEGKGWTPDNMFAFPDE